MSLRSKIVLILLAVVSLYAAADFVNLRFTVLPGFVTLDQQDAEKDISRVVEAIQKEASDLDQLCLNWSSWDETYDYVATKNERFEKANLGISTLKRNEIDFIIICDNEGKAVWHSALDPDTSKPVVLREFPSGGLSLRHPCLATIDSRGGARGLIATEHKPMLMSARPILTSEKQGPRRGTVVMGRFLSDHLDETLTKQTSVDFEFWHMDPRKPLPADEEAIRDELTEAARPIIKEHGDQLLYAYSTLNDYRGRPDFLVRANHERQISSAGRIAVNYAIISTLAAGFIILFVMMGLLQKTVLSPISLLTRHAVQIGKTEDFRAKLNLKRGDEIGTLSNEFNQMMEKLESARAALVDTARTAGKSEIATGILHNVGNLLNSVNISAGLLVEKVNGMRTKDLEKLSGILQEHATDLANFIQSDPRGKHLQPALSALSQHMGAQRTSMAKELGSLTDGIECIRELVKSQQSFAIQASIEEPASLSEQVEKAVRLTEKAGGTDKELKVNYQFAKVPDLLVDKHKLLEILVNVIQNARQAMEMAPENPRQLTIQIEEKVNDRILISITDSGVGIAPENLVKVFNLGFTTKPNGHGFGLHSAANAATEMGGSLTARSDGAGKGATFMLEIPKKVCVSAGVN